MLRPALAALLALLIVAPAATATPRRPPLRPTSVSAPTTDGRAVTAWQDAEHAGVVHVLRDDRPRSQSQHVPLPSGCDFGANAATTLAVVCTRADGLSFGELRLLDFTGATLRTLDIARLTTDRANGEAYFATALGGAAATLWGVGNHVSFKQYVDLDDGSAVDRGPDTPDTALDLDAPNARAPMCAPLRRLSLRDAYAYRAPALLEIRGGRALLSRCGSARRRDLGPAYGRELVVNRRYAAVTNGDSVTLHRIADGATFHYKMPDEPFLAGTEHRLWVSTPTGHPWVIEP